MLTFFYLSTHYLNREKYKKPEKSKYLDFFGKFSTFAEIFIAMKRKIEQKLVDWKNNPNHKPLIVNGARQIGKTYSILEFGIKNYQNIVHINLEKNRLAAAEFEGDLSPATIVLKLESLTKERILPEKTLLFFDEIQASERALTSLKYFCEDAPEYHVVAAGSLPGVAANREKYSFPVGKVDEFYMYPFVPVEVKKGKRNRAISLSNFVKRYDCPYSIKISQKNFGFENNIKSIPFYALFCLNFD